MVIPQDEHNQLVKIFFSFFDHFIVYSFLFFFFTEYYSMDYSNYCKLQNQPIAIFTINATGHHIRQRSYNAKFYKWKLNLKKSIKCKSIKRVESGKLHHQCSDMVLSKHKNGLKFSDDQNLDKIISHLSTTNNLEKGIVCGFNVDVMNCEFPSENGIQCLAFIRASIVTNRTDEESEIIGQKIKCKLMFYDNMLKDNQIILDKLQSLSWFIVQEVIVRRKIAVGTVYAGTWYVSRMELIRQNPQTGVSNHQHFIDYDYINKPIASLDKLQLDNAHGVEQNKSSKVIIGITTSVDVFKDGKGKYFGKAIHAFLTQSESKLKKTGKVEISNRLNRIKYWTKPCDYYFKCKKDKDYLGRNFKLAMEVAGGVRMRKNVESPSIFRELEEYLIKQGIINKRYDAIAANLYKAPGSSIEFHCEEDRYSDVVIVNFGSNQNIMTYLSINQSGIHGTTEVDIPCKHGDVSKFNSLVSFFFCVLDMFLLKPLHLVNKYPMKWPNKHGIDRVNLRMPKKSWRIAVLFRDLQPNVKRQAIHHRDNCGNDDTNDVVMKACNCKNIK